MEYQPQRVLYLLSSQHPGLSVLLVPKKDLEKVQGLDGDCIKSLSKAINFFLLNLGLRLGVTQNFSFLGTSWFFVLFYFVLK